MPKNLALTDLIEESSRGYVRPWKKVSLPGRNEPCICGSGKKFKKCCLEKFENGEYEKYSEQ